MHLPSCDLLITDMRLLTADFSILTGVDMAIDQGKIIKIAPRLKESFQARETVNGKNKLAMPGLIDGHTHLSQQLLRGMISDEYPIIYQRFNLPHESKLSAEDISLSVKLAALEMIRSGTTAFADAGSTHMDAFVEAVEASGLRATITRATSDKGDLPANMLDSTREGIKKSKEFYQDYNNRGEGRIKAWFQFRTLASCTDELIVGLSELSREYETGIHTHISEYSESVLYALNTQGQREIEYLNSLGVMTDNLLAAHCLLISEGDIDILGESGTKVVHCPRSNLGKVVSKTPQLLSKGVSVGLGTDGTAHAGLSLFREMTAFRHSQIVHNGAPYLDFGVMDSKKLLHMATMGSATALMQEASIGSLEEGKKADLILIDLEAPHLTPTHNLVNTLTEAVGAGDVSDSIVDGRLLMKDRQMLTLDEEKILYQSRKAIKKINGLHDWPSDKLACLS